MKCADPTLCYIDSKGKRIFRSFSYYKVRKGHFIPSSHIVFDCGKCLHCRKKKAYELACKCVLHSSLYEQNCFLTLTYDEKRKGYHNEMDYTDIQKFKKRLRVHANRIDNRRLEVFNVHEYGKLGKKHWHLIVFNYRPLDCEMHTMRNNIPLYTSRTMEKLWPYGFSTIGDVSEASAMYTAQYMEKDFKHHNHGTKRKSHSKHSGIGRPYFEKHYAQILSLGFIPINGRKLPVPRSFQRIAHKHYSHFYLPSSFYDTPTRKALYRPFLENGKRYQQPNRHMADLYTHYMDLKSEFIKTLETEWDAVISQYLTTKEDPDFIKSNENTLYDLRNKTAQENF